MRAGLSRLATDMDDDGRISRRASISALGGDNDEQYMDVNDIEDDLYYLSDEEVPMTKVDKGKGRQIEPESGEEEDEGHRELTPKLKKTRMRCKEQIPAPNNDNEDKNPSGLRRSQRHRYPRLAFWRLEKVVYGRGDFVPQIKAIIRVPLEAPPPLGNQMKRKPAR